ncbi:MAG TPA: LPXTG cell wall anchor domain-containing protein [Chloroflexia bacterium]|nr:LPXTG cell wall anchor domain-containing protein [Chloroflexia bacterium]
MNNSTAYSLTSLFLIGAPVLPATGEAANPTIFIVILVIATLAIIAGIFLLRRKPPI